MPTNLYGPGDNYDANSSRVMASLIRKNLQKPRKIHCPKLLVGGQESLKGNFFTLMIWLMQFYVALENWDPNSQNSPRDNYGNILSLLNVGTGVDISIKDLALKVAEITKFKGEIKWDRSKPDGTPKKLLNIQRLKNLGWESTITLDSGLKDTIKNYSQIDDL